MLKPGDRNWEDQRTTECSSTGQMSIWCSVSFHVGEQFKVMGP